MEVNMAPCMSSGTTSRFGCPATLIGDVRRRRDGEEVTSFFLLDFDAHLLCVQQVEAVVYQETVEKEVHWYRAEVPHRMSI